MTDPATPLTRRGTPRYPIACPICETLLGAYYRDGLSLKAHCRACTSRCMTLWNFARSRRNWRELPSDLRTVDLAARKLDHETRLL